MLRDARWLKDRLFTMLVVAGALLAVAPLFHLLYGVLAEGGRVLLEEGLGFLVSGPAPAGAGEVGGILPALVGTTVLALLSTAIGLPLAFFTAVMLAEYRDSRFTRIVRSFTMSLLEVPTILVGMLVYSLVVVPMGRYSLLAGGIALAIVMLPYVATYVERALDGVPQTYREAGYAMGMTRFQVVYRVLVGIAGRGIAAGIMIGFAKALGETAPLLFTIGSARSSVNANPLKPGDAIPLLIFQYAMTPYENWRAAAWGASLILTLIVLAIYAALKLAVKEVKLI